jgi:hypothetical protein
MRGDRIEKDAKGGEGSKSSGFGKIKDHNGVARLCVCKGLFIKKNYEHAKKRKKEH